LGGDNIKALFYLNNTKMQTKKRERFATINFKAMENLNITHKEFLVLNYIDSLCKNGVKEYCFASNLTICRELNLSERTLYRILSVLEGKNLIKRVTRSIGNDGKERRIFSTIPSAKVADIYR
jgi:DNA-binding MarR family transcriptional regulator